MGWVLGRQAGLSPKRGAVCASTQPNPFISTAVSSIRQLCYTPIRRRGKSEEGAGPQRTAVRGGVVSGVEGQRKRVVLAKRAASGNANGRGGVERRSLTRGLVPHGRIVGLILHETVGESCSLPSCQQETPPLSGSQSCRLWNLSSRRGVSMA